MMHGTIKDTMKTVRGLSPDDVFLALGLERRRGPMGYLLPALGYFAVGLVVGTGITLLVGPKSTKQVRRELSDKARNILGQLGSAAEKVTHEARSHLAGSEGKADEGSLPRSSTALDASASTNARK